MESQPYLISALLVFLLALLLVIGLVRQLHWSRVWLKIGAFEKFYMQIFRESHHEYRKNV